MKSNKILIGRKGKSDIGFRYVPYIKLSELVLPLKFVGYDKNNQPIFIKLKDE